MLFGSKTTYFSKSIKFIRKYLKKTAKQVPVQTNSTTAEFDKNATEKPPKPVEDKVVGNNSGDFSTQMDKMQKELEDCQYTIVYLAKALTEQKGQNIQLKLSLAGAENRTISAQTETDQLKQDLKNCQHVIVNLTKMLENKKDFNTQLMESVSTSEKSTICTQTDKIKPEAKKGEITQTEPVLTSVRKPAPGKHFGVQNLAVSEPKQVSSLLPERPLEIVATFDEKQTVGNPKQAPNIENVSVQSNEEMNKTKTETKKIKSPKPVKERPLVKMITGFMKQKEKQVNPKKTFCQLSNWENNCWMNSSVQAIANLQAVRTALHTCTTEDLMLSAVPSFSEMFLDVLNNPGKRFSPKEISPVLKDISRAIPTLKLGEQNDIADFFNPVLDWLEKCGVQSSLEASHVSHCNNCGHNSTNTFSVGNMAFMFMTQRKDSTSALLHRMLQDNPTEKRCSVCQSKTSRSSYLNSPDLVVLYVPRQSVGRDPVVPDATLAIPQQTGTQTYNLASVVCHREFFCVAHFYTYVNYKNRIVVADDMRISVAKNKDMKDMYENGIIYVYERCTDEGSQSSRSR